MSYIIEPMSIITFVEDNKMKLPRFQRKATWDAKQNFELCISIFQDYPVGVVIVNKEQNVSWLLDGRQRRTALKEMRANPVSVYEWAKSYIGFKSNVDEFELTKNYWDKIERYLQTEEKTQENTNENNDVSNYGDDEDTIENSFDSEKQKRGLQTLLDIILMVHQNKASGSKWEKAFDFTKYFSRLIYAPKKENGKVQPRLLRKFLLDLKKECGTDDLTRELVIDYYYERYDILDKNKPKFEAEIDKHWEYLKHSIEIIEQSEKVFEEARIGIIKLTNVSPLDAQNIFSRINRGGTLLKAEELLSAKPYWNVAVNVSDQNLINIVKDMYKKLEVEEPESIVRWDLAATLIPRIKDHNLFFDSYDSYTMANKISIDQVVLGFKLISSYFEGGMSGKCVTDLEKNNSINWEVDIDDLIDDINKLCEILMTTEFFQYFQAWKKPMTKLLGNAITLEFITIMLRDWKKKDKPIINSADLKVVQRDARILFDRLVFEYATKVWRGSGDSKMASDINDWENRILPIDGMEWKKFISSVCYGMYNGQVVSYKSLTPVLYYYYILTNCSPLNMVNVSYDVDHIIPQEKFKDNNMVDGSAKDSLANLALLPKKDNIHKKNKALNEITDPWLKNSIVTYTGISEDKFDLYSDIINIKQLQNERSELFITAFDTNRTAKLSN